MSKDNDDKNQNDPFNFFNFGPDSDGDDKKSPKKPFFSLWLLAPLVVIIFILINQLMVLNSSALIPFSEFKDRITTGQIKKVVLGPVYFTGYTSIQDDDSSNTSLFSFLSVQKNTNEYVTVGIYTSEFLQLLDDHHVVYHVKPKERSYIVELLLQWVLPFLLIFLVWRAIMRRMTKGMGGLGGSIFSPGQARSAAIDEGKVETRFKDVAGVDEAKEELMEVVDFLKYPQKYTEIGGKIPRGVLLVGPPGTGKTLLARAVAGEAGVPFFRISGSDFVEMFVGVGASRVRDLFRQAREKAPCIIFIDELDAIGKSRHNSYSSNDEREQTLNQLLVEMDGFDNKTGLILLAATNRPDVLDPALLRPGRFDRQVVVDRPDVKGREQILKLHAENVKLDASADLASIARITAGCSGADLANIINEAALLAVRSKRKTVIMTDLDEAVEKAMIGLQKKSRVIREEERKVIAYHETGHAIVGSFTDGADKVHKVTIVPRGTSTLGYTFHIPEDDKHIVTEKQLLAEIDVLLGGRAAEQVKFNMVSTGAANDLTRATDIARSLITDYGMSSKFKNVALSKRGAGYLGDNEPRLVREYAETTQQYIDEEIAKIINTRYEGVIKMLNEKKHLLEKIATTLLEKETIENEEFDAIIAEEKAPKLFEKESE
ncbi:ATP-dependent metallopeptidase FtsH/Yme1/Tma family protein [Treponema denticola]|uniref:ATP-dependent zinc metalloprotease FtsH n=2 Tax=Treponema denticola TaxID=158 RepID=Q73QH3_TREDE|nr:MULTISPECIES: ATP-dependent zinc metalloprotease FtsH [Treponema]AAS10965.1 cell division protein FtsH [Treponema denticola ATCC 35405]EGC78843.1 cell division protein FtsH [Treponema denticola F0402]EMB31503.1 ATP-dependent zinc metalloprotease FtsH [Treponema denticola H-22]EMB35126.1 ATP-dependent zinc metalloprotease FtsH [Treponema denticola ATCC 35404]EMB35768.1 ATP-dependent zinc metalloprotease FtsH [Treponema denticola ATCC 33521]